MNNLNIPLFRAKKIDSDEYVIGFYIFDGVRHLLLVDRGNLVQIQIDPTTLAIHFPDMLDSQGNKIFASLNIKGGSLIEYEGAIYEVMYLNYLIQGVTNMHSIKSELFEYTKLIGIQK